MNKQKIKKRFENIDNFHDLVEFVANDLEYSKLMDSKNNVQRKNFWNETGEEVHLMKEDRSLVRIIKVKKGEKPFQEIKRHIKKGRKNRELFTVFTFVKKDSEKIANEIRFFWLHSRMAEDDVDIEHDLKYFEVNPKELEPVYLDYLDDLRVRDKTVGNLENTERDGSLRDIFSIEKITKKFYKEFQKIIEEDLQPAISGLENKDVERYRELISSLGLRR